MSETTSCEVKPVKGLAFWQRGSLWQRRVVVVAALFVLWMLPYPVGGVSKARLPDGTWLVVEQVSWGKYHGFQTPVNNWLAWLWRDRYADGFPTKQEKFVVWITRRNAWGDYLGLENIRHCQIRDSSGEAFGGEQVHHSAGLFRSSFSGSGMWRDGRPGTSSYAYAFAHMQFPKVRWPFAKTQLDVWGKDQTILATLQVPSPNTHGVIHDDWKADRLPTDQDIGDLRVHLVRVFHEDSQHSSWEMTKSSSTRTKIVLYRGKEVIEDWDANAVLISDVRGNEYPAYRHQLSRQDEVWKLTVQLKPIKDHFTRTKRPIPCEQQLEFFINPRDPRVEAR